MIKKEREVNWPLTPEELLASFDEGPLPELYNAIFYTAAESAKLMSMGMQ